MQTMSYSNWMGEFYYLNERKQANFKEEQMYMRMCCVAGSVCGSVFMVHLVLLYTQLTQRSSLIGC